MLIDTAAEPKLLIVPVFEVVEVWQFVKVTLPKLGSWTMPKILLGASAIHSAEDLEAPLTARESVKDLPVVVSEILTVNKPEAYVTLAVKELPG